MERKQNELYQISVEELIIKNGDKDVYGKNYTGSNGYTSDDSKTHYLQSLEESDWCSSFKYYF